MPPTPSPPLSPLKAITRDLLDKITQLDHYAGAAGSAEFKAALDQSSKLFNDLRDLLNKSKTSTISDFFNAVGNSLIEAQNRLDEASEEYVRGALRLGGRTPSDEGAAAGAPVMGTIYRIPRVTAELKCSMSTDHEKGFNVVFYSERSDIRDLHQQTVQLEVVSVPAPPDYINYLRSQPASRSIESPSAFIDDQPTMLLDPGPGQDNPTDGEEPLLFLEPGEPSRDIPAEPSDPVSQVAPPEPVAASAPALLPPDWLQATVADAAERAQVRSLLEKLDTKQRQESGRRRSLVKKLLLPAWSRAIVLTDGHNARFILLAVMRKRPRLLLWQLVVRPASLQLLYKMATKKRPELVRIQRFLAALGKSQAAAEFREL